MSKVLKWQMLVPPFVLSDPEMLNEVTTEYARALHIAKGDIERWYAHIPEVTPDRVNFIGKELYPQVLDAVNEGRVRVDQILSFVRLCYLSDLGPSRKQVKNATDKAEVPRMPRKAKQQIAELEKLLVR